MSNSSYREITSHIIWQRKTTFPMATRSFQGSTHLIFSSRPETQANIFICLLDQRMRHHLQTRKWNAKGGQKCNIGEVWHPGCSIFIRNYAWQDEVHQIKQNIPQNKITNGHNFQTTESLVLSRVGLINCSTWKCCVQALNNEGKRWKKTADRTFNA